MEAGPNEKPVHPEKSKPSGALGSEDNAAMLALSSKEDGINEFDLSGGHWKIRFSNDGMTQSIRELRVGPQSRMSLIDPWLTPLDSLETEIGLAGGIAKGGERYATRLPLPAEIPNDAKKSYTRRIYTEAVNPYPWEAPVSLYIPSRALSEPVKVRLTLLSPTGLIFPMPVGWRSLFAIQIDPVLSFQDKTEGKLTIHLSRQGVNPRPDMDKSRKAYLVRFDEQRLQWIVVSELKPPLLNTSGDISALIGSGGQFSIAQGDDVPLSPPAPKVGTYLVGLSREQIREPNWDNPLEFQLEPRVIPPDAIGGIDLYQGLPIRTRVEVLYKSVYPLPSGLWMGHLNMKERYEEVGAGGEGALPVIIEQRVGDQQRVIERLPNGKGPLPYRARAILPIAYHRPLVPLVTLDAEITGKVTAPMWSVTTEGKGRLIGPAGGVIDSEGEGWQLEIPAGALESDTIVAWKPIVNARPWPWGKGLAGFELDIGNVVLKKPAIVYWVKEPAQKMVLVSNDNISGSNHQVRLIAPFKRDGAVVKTVDGPWVGLIRGGVYFIAEPEGSGIVVSGTVVRAGIPVLTAEVSSGDSQGGPFFDESRPDFAVLMQSGTGELFGFDSVMDDRGTVVVSSDVDLAGQILELEVKRPKVLNVTPERDARSVSLSQQIHLIVSRPLAEESIAKIPASAMTTDGRPVPGQWRLRGGGKQLLFVPEGGLGARRTYTVQVGNEIIDRFKRPLDPFSSSFMTHDPSPPTAPVGAITVSMPNEAGQVAVAGGIGSVRPGDRAVLINQRTRVTQSVEVNADGSFLGTIMASVTDRLILRLIDEEGKSSERQLAGGLDPRLGQVIFPEGANTITGPEGSMIELMPYAFSEPIAVQVKTSTAADRALPPGLDGVGNRFEVTMTALDSKIPQRLSYPARFSISAPGGFSGDAPLILIRLKERSGADPFAWEVIDDAKIVGEVKISLRVTTASWPFPGLRDSGLFAFAKISPDAIPIVLHGNLYRDRNGNGQFDYTDTNKNGRWDVDEPMADMPVPQATVWAEIPPSFSLSTTGGERPPLFAVSDENGHYAVIALVSRSAVVDASSSIPIRLVFLDPVTHQEKGEGIPVDPKLLSTFNGFSEVPISVKVSDLADTPLPDPTVTIRLSGEGYSSGFVEIGKNVPMAVEVINGVGIDWKTLRVNLSRNRIDLNGEMIPDSSSSFIFTPKQTGRHRVEATIQDRWGRSFFGATDFWVESSGGMPVSRPGPPEMTSLVPSDGSEAVPIDTTFEIVFNERVVNADTGTIKLFYNSDEAMKETPVAIQQESAAGGMRVLVTPKRNLAYSGEGNRTTEYRLEVGKVKPILDADGERLVSQTATFRTFRLKKGTPSLELTLPKDQARLGDYLYIVDREKESAEKRSYLRVADIADPDLPVFVGTPTERKMWVQAVDVSGGYYFASRRTDKIAVLVARWDMPVTLYSTTPMQQNVSPLAGGNSLSNQLIATDATKVMGRIEVYDISNPSDPKSIGSGLLTDDGVPLRVKVVGRYAYVATVNRGLQVIDLEKVVDPTHKIQVNHLDIHPTTGAHLGLAGAPGLPPTPGTTFKDDVVIDTFPLEETPFDLEVGANGQLYVLTPANLFVFDMSVSPSLELIKATSLKNGFRLRVATDFSFRDGKGEERRGDVAFVSTGSNGEIQIYDVTPAPLSPGEGKSDRVIPLANLLGRWNVGGSVGNMVLFPEKGILVLNRRMGSGVSESAVFDIREISNTPKELGVVSNGYSYTLVANEAKTHFLTVGSPGTGVAVSQSGNVTWQELSSGEKVRGVVTDGVTRVRAKIEIDGADVIGKAEIALKDNTGNGGLCSSLADGPCNQESVGVSLVKRGEVYVLSDQMPVYYQGPETFVRFGDKESEESDKGVKSRMVEFVVRDAKSIDKEFAKGKIDLHRPPVVLIHGLWGSGASHVQNPLTGKDEENPNYTWKSFDLNQQGHYTVKAVDYSKENAYSFEHSDIRKKLKNTIKEVLGEVRDQKLAAQKVDVVSHSMGGLVVRSFCADQPDECKNSIRKLITIDTPHQGSELANLVVNAHAQPGSSCAEVLPKIHATGRQIWVDEAHTTLAGAHHALSVGSAVLTSLANSSFPVPLITAIGQTQIGFQPLLFAHDEEINRLWQGLWRYCGKVPDSTFFEYFGLLDTVFPEGGNDRIVSASSQLGPATELKEVFKVDHETILGNQEAVDWVREKLEGQP
jgi:pimeloyl-ACP methyl ester carboxylesterase